MRRLALNISWMFQNLFAGLRLAIFAPVSRRSFHVSIDQLIILLIPATGVTVLAIYLVAGSGITFAPHFWEALLSRAFLDLLLYYLVSRLQRAPHRFPAIAIVIVSAHTTVSLLQVLIAAITRFSDTTPIVADTLAQFGRLPGVVVAVITMAWGFAAATRSVRLVYSEGWFRAGLTGAGIVLVSAAIGSALPLFALPASPQAGAEAQQARVEPARRPAVDTEQTYDAQPRLIAGRINALASARPGIGELYFIGFAGTSTQDVFLKEVQAAQNLFDDRFDTRNRSLILVNNPRTIRTLPVASVTNLVRAVAGIASKMNVEDDILFLYMTSHGAPHVFAVDFPELALDSLSDGGLRSILDRAGIKWRVIVISACYSGSFIDALKDDHTLIMTAAAADRTSFGCGNEDEFTYFGDAYVNQALRVDRSFITAFDRAREIVAAREEAEQETPSEPQIYIGAAMEAKLRDFELRLAEAPRATGAQ